ncbi:putative glutaminase [Talaromyces proteolyticus]|uniref:Glutaminase n=1 Tax=Talaromyces proteolyticus TaxID=1131652 RepID=A0AAD4PT57_9EURO|nr:putative glutaminase [Talaromyces proteolyticus]KAH8692700.1 putative glutaminase [Talaromyces proteolyticus]
MRWSVVALAGPLLQSALSAASALTPPVLPLTVRNPYFSTWLADARDVPWSKWPIFWTGEELGFSLLAQVPSSNTVYPLLGRPQDSLPNDGKSGYKVDYPTYNGATYDASTTNLTYVLPGSSDSSKLEIILSFLSPITPTSTLRQSIPASYLTIHVAGSVDVNVYVDMNGQWVSGDRDSQLVWDFNDISVDRGATKLKKWQFTRQNELLVSEIRDRAEWGTLHFVAPKDVRHEAGTSRTLRDRFSRSGTLQDTVDRRFRSIMDEEPVFAFSKHFALGSGLSTSSDSVRFTIAHTQDIVIQYASSRGLTYMRPLWKSWFPTAEELLSFHYSDFSDANSLASNYSDQLAIDAYKSGADDYVDIVTLSARQVLGATSFSGTAENPLLFLKEISSDGNTQTIDVIYPAFPFFLYTSPRWLAYLLEPLVEHMLSGQYPNTYAMHDLGTHFPNATGHPDGNDEYMPVEECGNILIMGLALVNSLRYTDSQESVSPWAGQGHLTPETLYEGAPLFPLLDLRTNFGIDKQDGRWGGPGHGAKDARKWVQRSYRLWKQWTGYLVEFSLEPENQLSTDDFAGWLALQTNLALKGIIGINAMSQIADVAGQANDASHFKNIADDYVAKWEEFGMSRDGTHAKLAYDWYGSWTTLYNIYADAQLCFHLDGVTETVGDFAQTPLRPKKQGFVPRHIYQKQSNWYHYVRQKYGLPLDSRHLYTKTDWEFFSMAVASEQVRSEILESVATWVNETATDRPFTDLHETEGNGGYPGIFFIARPVVGGHFAFLALQRACGGKAMDGLSFLDDVDPDGDELTAAAAAEFNRMRRPSLNGDL